MLSRFPNKNPLDTGVDIMKKISVNTGDSGSSEENCLCAACPANELNLCRAVIKPSWVLFDPATALLASSEHSVSARQDISDPTQLHDVVPIICRGWAASSATLVDGRRQILSFLLPGDLVSTALVFGATAGRAIVAITNVTYRTFNRFEFQTLLSKRPDLLARFSRIWAEERVEADQLAMDLGRRTADERLARLILKLMQRLSARGMVRGQSMEFPLRQHHIADAMGLTPVHVSRVLTNFRRKKLIDIGGGFLTILNADELCRIAGI